MKTLDQRFFDKVEKTESCWVWTGHINNLGYGKISFKLKPQFAHRISWFIHFGEIPAGMCVLHRCDNPACVNPAHLFLGTMSDNTQDMMRKGRQADLRGENGPLHRLTNDQVLEIRRRAAAGETKASLGREFGISGRHAGGIVNRETWKHI